MINDKRDIRGWKLAVDVALILAGCVIATVAFVAFQHAPRAGYSPIATNSPAQIAASMAGTPPADSAAVPSTEPTLSAAVAGLAVSPPALPAEPQSPTPGVFATDKPQVAQGGSGTDPGVGRAGTMSATVAPGTRYVDPHGEFSLVRPVDWQPLSSQVTGVAVQFVSEKPRGNLNIVTQFVPLTMTVNQFATAAVAESERMYPAYRLDARGIEPAIIGGEPARQYAFRGVQDGTPIVFTQLVALKEGVAYVVTLTAAADESGAFAAQARVVTETFTFHA